MLQNFVNIGDVTLHQRVVDISRTVLNDVRDHDVLGQPMYLPQGFALVGGFSRTLDGDTLTGYAVGITRPVDDNDYFATGHRYTNAIASISRRFREFARADFSFDRDEYLVAVTQTGIDPSPTQLHRLELNFLLRRLF